MDKLQEIMAWKRQEIAPRIRPVRAIELERAGQSRPSGKGFAQALRQDGRLAVIAEIKRRSPSAGTIAELPDAAEQARRYYNAGTDALSILTDEKFFGGSLRDLWEVTDLLNPRADAPPALRKDFMVHPIQVLEAAESGAACILIIVRALEDPEIRQLQDAASQAGLDCLFEIHSEAELERALRFDPPIIGVNNRDLARFRTNLTISESLIPQIPRPIVRVSESGIFSGADAARARSSGADAILVGEALMRAEDPDALMAELQGL